MRVKRLKWQLIVLMAFSAVFVVGCAGLMMDVKDASRQNAGVKLEEGLTVSVLPANVAVVQEEYGEEEARRVASLI